MTQLEHARKGRVTPLMRAVARSEKVDAGYIREGVAAGTIVLPRNAAGKRGRPCGIGKGLRTKINVNLGTSRDSHRTADELKKLDLAIMLDTDTVMDLSTGPNFMKTRCALLRRSTVPFGTVPVYEAAIRGIEGHGTVDRLTTDDFFAPLEAQAREGVDFFTIHAGVTRHALDLLKRNGRVLDIVSRGGAFMARWMLANGRENPYYEYFDRVCDIAARHDVTLSLGDGMRPGAIADATDAPQLAELMTLGELQQRAMARGVQVMIEGPGHLPINEIAANVALEKSLCHGAPFYVLGPLVTDIAPGYDHITSAIGGAIAGMAGADFLCFVTPAEHVRLPTLEDVREGTVAAKIAAHAADIGKGIPGAAARDREISRARKERDWKRQFRAALDEERPRRYRAESTPDTKDVCTMCSDYCSIKTAEACLSGVKR